jgi:hypothetical protein
MFSLHFYSSTILPDSPSLRLRVQRLKQGYQICTALSNNMAEWCGVPNRATIDRYVMRFLSCWQLNRCTTWRVDDVSRLFTMWDTCYRERGRYGKWYMSALTACAEVVCIVACNREQCVTCHSVKTGLSLTVSTWLTSKNRVFSADTVLCMCLAMLFLTTFFVLDFIHRRVFKKVLKPLKITTFRMVDHTFSSGKAINRSGR